MFFRSWVAVSKRLMVVRVTVRGSVLNVLSVKLYAPQVGWTLD